MTFTKSWLQKAISDIETMRDEIPFGLDEDGNNTLAALKLALAGMETKHNSVIAEQLDHVLSVMDVTAHQRAVISCAVDRLNKSAELLQQSPQPLTTSERSELENYRNAQQVVLDAATAIRACMEEFPDSVHDIVEECAAIAENACRAAMLQGTDGNDQVIPDGWVACSERMPSVGVQVLAYRPDAPESDDPLIRMATYLGKSAHGHGFDCYCKPTHWMPLPYPPKEVKNG